MLRTTLFVTVLMLAFGCAENQVDSAEPQSSNQAVQQVAGSSTQAPIPTTSSEEAEPQPIDVLTRMPDFQLQVNDITEAYHNNLVAADQRYGGKQVYIGAVLSETRFDHDGNPILVVTGSKWSDRDLDCEISEAFVAEETAKIALLQPGDVVWVMGIVEKTPKTISHLDIVDCRLVVATTSDGQTHSWLPEAEDNVQLGSR